MCKVTPNYYAGCVFYTTAETEYKIRVLLRYQGNTVADVTDSVKTRSEIKSPSPLRIFYVAPGGSGISQNRNTPGKLDQTLLDNLQAGDKILLLPGRYFTGELLIKTSGSESNPIILEGENDSVFIDGSIPGKIDWTRVTQDTANGNYNMFYASIGALNTNCMVRGNSRMYPYRNLMELGMFSSIRAIDGNGNANGVFKIGEDGFFRDGRDPVANTFPWIAFNANTYIKFADGSDTTGMDLHVSTQAYAFYIQNQNHLQFRRLHFVYFGAAKQFNYRSAIVAKNVDFLVADSCQFTFCDHGISFIGNSDHNTVQHSRFVDDFAKLSYFGFKETGLDYQHVNLNYPNFFPLQARNVEPGRIYFDRNFTGRGNIVRFNYISGGCDGITCPVTPGDSTTARHFDIHGNEFGAGSDDAFEVDGNGGNIRVWDNKMYGAANGISIASPCYGPVYVFRNVMHDFRKTVYQYVVNITTMVTDTIPGSPVKLNAAYCDIPGKVYFMHNTCVSGTDAYGLVLFQPQTASSWSEFVSRNNIFYNQSDYFSLWVRATDSVDLDYDIYYRPKGFLARQDRPGYQQFTSFSAMQNGILGNINDPNSKTETHGFFADPTPGWIDPMNSNFQLKYPAIGIDKGQVIAGLNDNYSGNAPDIGAFEYLSGSGIHSLDDLHLELYPVPASEILYYSILAEKITVLKIQIADISGKIVSEILQPNTSGEAMVSDISNGLYFMVFYTSQGKSVLKIEIQH